MGGGGVANAEPRVLHTITGRMRVHVPEWSGQGRLQIENRLRQLQGVQHIQANPITSTILVVFDPELLSKQAILQEIQALDLEQIKNLPVEPARPHVAREKQGKTVRARIAVRGLDRDPSLAKHVVKQLEKHSGVQAHANPLTGRVLVEFTEHEVELDDLISEVANVELPDLQAEDRPAYPLDPAPLIQGVTRSVGTALGLSFLAGRRLTGHEEALPGEGAAAYAAGMIGLLQGIPHVRDGMRKALGRHVTDLLFSLPGIVLLTLSRSPLGLTLAGAESLRLLSEVQERRGAWKLHEARVAEAPSAQPDAILRLESGERVPLAASIHEGTGTATGLDGLPLPVYPGALIPPGACLYGGPFVLQLKSEASFESFVPQPRSVPTAPTFCEQYQRVLAPISLAYAGLTGLLTRSLGQAFVALLLVSPRTALIGTEGGELNANARVLRAGVTIVGTRTERSIRLPKLLLLDGARLLTERLELTNALPLSDEMSANEALARAAGISNAAGSPWGGIFHATSLVSATNGHFNGMVATARADDVHYTLGPLEDWGIAPEAAYLRQRGNYVLALRREQDERPLALFALRPRLAPSVQTLVASCQRLGVELALLSQGNELALRELAHRARIALIESDSALTVIAQHQRKGELVAFVSDHAGAMAGFAACDLAIGMTDDRSRFPARADLLAPDLAAVTAILEAGARREASARDSVILSIASNLAGVFWGLNGLPGVRAASRAVYITSLGALADGWLRQRGGKRARSTVARLVDPQPERWGRRSVDETLHLLNTTGEGLSSKQASERRRKVHVIQPRNALYTA
ncbi:MAG TPA: haloacid dehalogenase, partial [Ktedonobacteraceae bacterium]|nr:haloacid dehalogenase [Ktedonobacteraceae bacterium]